MTKTILAAALAIGALALSSCVTPEELRRQDEARCVGFGFQTGTADFATCLQRESLARRYAPPPTGPYWGYWAYWGPGPFFWP
jgi:hypothetical protein